MKKETEILSPKFVVGQRVILDTYETAKIKKIGRFRKNRREFYAYQLSENILPGFWAEEDRLKEIK